jgi:beta-glucosidase
VNYKRLVAFDRIPLAPGEAKTVTLRIDPTLLSIYDESKDGWDLLPGEYQILAGPVFERNTAHRNVPYRKVKQSDAASHLNGGR